MARLIDIERETEKAVLAFVELDDGTVSKRAHWWPKSHITGSTPADWIVQEKLKADAVEAEEDRFGRTIPADVMVKLDAIRERLLGLGFKESSKKPLLFFIPLRVNFPGDRKGAVTIFVDFRGSSVISIAEDISGLTWCGKLGEYRLENLAEGMPFFYECGFEWTQWNGFGNSPLETQEYFRDYMIHHLSLFDIPARPTFDQFTVMVDKYHEASGTPASELESRMRETSSYVRSYSDEIKPFSKKEQWLHCRVCERPGTPSGFWADALEDWIRKGARLELHHVSYVPEIVIPVCKVCHTAIHSTDRYPHLKPEMTREEWLQSKQNES
jgi:hypothetical protein